MAQAIETRYLGPTDFRGSRVKATCEAASVTLSWDDALDSVGNHDAAARALIRKMRWEGSDWYRGATKDSPGYVYVRASRFDLLDTGSNGGAL
jgi:hypothetical protein